MLQTEIPASPDYLEKFIDIVFGLPGLIILLVILFAGLLRKFLTVLADQAEQGVSSFEVGKDKFAVQFANTEFGNTKVSVEKVESANFLDNRTTHTSGKYKYRISWLTENFAPMNKSNREAMEKSQKMKGLLLPGQDVDLIVTDTKSDTSSALSEEFKTNVNIIVYPSPELETPILRFIQQIEQMFTNIGISVDKTIVDPASDSALIEYQTIQELPTTNGKVTINLNHVSKFSIYSGLVYHVTATFRSPDENESNSQFNVNKIRMELNEILNSFEIVVN